MVRGHGGRGGRGGWQGELGGRRLLVSGFGKWGGGAYDLTGGRPDALDDLPTSGLAVGGGRLWRVLRAPGEQTSACELLSYDVRGIRTYERLDAVRDPHDVCWFAGAVHLASSWDDAVWRLAGGHPEVAWRAPAGAATRDVPDRWHVNSLTVVGGALHACAFGRSDRYKGWKAADRRDTGVVLDLATGRDALTGLSQPHTPRRVGDRWYVCESLIGTLTECDAQGRILRRASVERFTRGLAILGRWALVGGNAHREEEGDRAEVVVVDLADMAVVDRIPLPCLEVYDIVPVAPALARGLAVGFGANPARAVEQHRAGERPESARPTAPDARVRLSPPRVAGELARMGRALDRDEVRACGIRGRLAPRMAAGAAGTVAVEVVNRSPRALASVPPRVVKVAARWIPLGPARNGTADDDALVNPPVALPRIVHPGERAPLGVPIEVPDAPGRYQVRIALRQRGLGWFGVRLQAEVEVVRPAPAVASGTARRPGCSGCR